MQIKLIKMSSGVTLPTRGSAEAAGYDIRSNENVSLFPGKFKAVKTGLKVAEIPAGYVLSVRPRSGLAAKNGVTVLNTPGTIDSDYRGEIMVILINHGDKEFVISEGDRIAQVILEKLEEYSFVETDEFVDTERSEGGFGSTGKN